MLKQPELKGSTFTLSVLHLVDDNFAAAANVLTEKVTQAPAFFQGAPVVADISRLSQCPDIGALKQCLQATGMILVGLTGVTHNDTRELALDAQLAVLKSSKQSRVADPIQPPAKVVTAPVRSGQQIYAKNADLVILNHVSAGAEVIADGSIHIYGVLRGRAIAGASGQKQARIYCQNLQSELLSVAGSYWLSDKIPSEHIERPSMVSLNQESLHIDPLTL
ncbi:MULTISPECIES: septum site-determining protein MinC [Salinivibrio]|uniref:Probable septum site-determining protein MinC n=1 Tax=Salinivibrio kushneri TaxID=1908198 RepID=A0AB36K2P9_9GAMM|nr:MULTISPECIES: septum site-determining protein MinC [Salinivibrio]ODP98663.1 septum site-determining protein MinC [Salinivibrio sp. BNH]OOE36512.1 septum site-determining protein MinC [Salinivibrio kushneri]OOE41165.1 septum site-determining protein MinC [Salinivibrio kushneri]OOE41359.1 septum site-determining protein MinC [Salinivibrio kushneri]OOE43690.1 septum site-determining protein MinC [Salinivibrio kushneri]